MTDIDEITIVGLKNDSDIYMITFDFQHITVENLFLHDHLIIGYYISKEINVYSHGYYTHNDYIMRFINKLINKNCALFQLLKNNFSEFAKKNNIRKSIFGNYIFNSEWINDDDLLFIFKMSILKYILSNTNKTPLKNSQFLQIAHIFLKKTTVNIYGKNIINNNLNYIINEFSIYCENLFKTEIPDIIVKKISEKKFISIYNNIDTLRNKKEKLDEELYDLKKILKEKTERNELEKNRKKRIHEELDNIYNQSHKLFNSILE